MPLAPFTTLKVGGPARFFFEARCDEEVGEALAFAERHGLELFVLGGGSNILVSDAGFDGLVLKIALSGISPDDDETSEAVTVSGRVHLTAKAGEQWDSFVEYCVDRDLAGVECLSGIPGLVGGTPVQNVGAYGQEVAETIVSVRCFDRQSGATVELSNLDCGFSYRTSIFNSTERGRFIVFSVTFSLIRGGEPRIIYKDLKEAFEGQRPGLAEVRAAVLKIRSAKSMVIRAGDPNALSAGSFFKNPVVRQDKLLEVANASDVEAVPHFEAGDGLVKLPAAWLIEQAGFHKGFILGNAGISTNHTLAIVNRGNATADEILRLKEVIFEAVHAKFGIELVPEPVFVGF